MASGFVVSDPFNSPGFGDVNDVAVLVQHMQLSVHTDDAAVQASWEDHLEVATPVIPKRHGKQVDEPDPDDPDDSALQVALAGTQAVASENENWLCAICIHQIAPEDTAVVKGCEHAYCAHCILKWAERCKGDVWCPQCKTPFSFLYTYRSLDGSFHDLLMEESVCLLLRAKWYCGRDAQLQGSVGIDEYDYEDYYEEDEQEEYMSHRVLGNRRWGEHGYVRAGRITARPTVEAVKASSTACKPRSAATTKGKAPASSTTGSSSTSSSSNNNNGQGSGQGRRAKRQQRRALEDEVVYEKALGKKASAKLMY
eukprot:jgi/Chlat1/5343/Chrsp35S05277